MMPPLKSNGNRSVLLFKTAVISATLALLITVCLVAETGPEKAEQTVTCISPPPTKSALDPEWYLVWVGIATIVFIGWQSLETRKSAEATREQASVSRKAFVSQFRPIIRVKNVVLRSDSSAVDYVLANVGRSSARITSLNVRLTSVGAHQTFTPHDFSEDYMRNCDIAIDMEEVSLRSIDCDEAMATNLRIYGEHGDYPLSPIYLWGYIRYNGETGAGRGKRFCFRYNWATGRFSRIDRPKPAKTRA